MSRIEKTFKHLSDRNEKALVGFITAGDPDESKSLAIIDAMISGGVDVLEMGVPFSDPTADGPVIQRSSERALKSGASLGKILGMVQKIRKTRETPIVLFSYYNPILAYGPEKFYNDAVIAGADGLLTVDLPPEEAGELLSRWPGKDLDFIRLIAPTTPADRIKKITADASGFIYLVSVTGVTGGAGFDSSEVADVAGKIKSVSRLPICVGFGISKPEQVAAACESSDGAVVGSAFERIVEEHLANPVMPEMVGDLARSLKAATFSHS